ncbi:MAG: substrate-binding domain-containing protein, partial [Candidatus Thermoplasmatota archaeon]|nr:substrate-binding domain-containing protein [Candidatus Thermoplasmatota archaeon]
SITVEGGGSSSGAGRVCANSEKGTPVEIGDMSRDWKSSEADRGSDGYTMSCLKGDTTRKAIQLVVANDGLSVVMKKGGAAESCVNSVGGLTVDQLRWMFSSKTATELAADGWDSSSLGNPDSDDIREWSDLSSDCPDSAIVLAYPDAESGTYEYFCEAIMNDDCSFGTGTQSADDNVLVNTLTGNEAAVGYFGFAYYVENTATLSAAAVKNADGNYVSPSGSTVADGTYNPLSRPLFMNLNVGDLDKTAPFLNFGYGDGGDVLVEGTGYVPLTSDNEAVMRDRIAMSTYQTECGPDGAIAIAGSSTVLPLAEAWAQRYDADCSGSDITVEGGGSSSGAGRVCANSEKGTPVDIGDMSREWKTTEADRGADGYTMSCLKGDTSRKAVQIVVAYDGLSVVMKKGGVAEACVNALGGLTPDQLRYIFSGNTTVELAANGWDSSSLGNPDGDEIREWSDLSSDCDTDAIVLAYPDAESGTFEYFCEAIMHEECTFGTGTQSPDDNVLVNTLTGDGAAVGYFGYAYYIKNTATLAAAPVMNSAGDYVSPEADSVADGSYNPLARPIFMNLHTAGLSKTAPFLQFGFSNIGDSLVESVGYVPIPDSVKRQMLGRLVGETAVCGVNDIIINEIHQDGEPEDYIELKNVGSAACSLHGWHIADGGTYDSNDPSSSTGFTITGYALGVGEYWLGYEDEVESFTFGLSKGGEDVYLIAPDGTVVDQVTAGSYGDDGNSVNNCGSSDESATPSPGADNNCS